MIPENMLTATLAAQCVAVVLVGITCIAQMVKWWIDGFWCKWKIRHDFTEWERDPNDQRRQLRSCRICKKTFGEVI